MKTLNYLILISAFVFASCSGGNTPSDAAKKMTGYLKSQNYEKFVDGMLPSKNISDKEATEEKTMMLALLKDKGSKEFEKKKGINKVEILEETMAPDGETAEVKVKYFYGDDSTDIQTLNFRKVENEWKLYIKK